MKLSKVEKDNNVKIATVNMTKPSKEQSFDIEKEIKEILSEILQNIAKKS